MTDIDTAALRDIPEWVCTRTGDELTQYCHEQGCALGYYPAETVAPLLDEIDRLRAKLDAVREVHELTPHRDPHMDDCVTCSCCGFGIGPCATRRASDD